jgi:hypothetical protein
MFSKTSYLFILILASTQVFGQAYTPPQVKVEDMPVHDLRSIDHNAFKVGEKITYTVHYGWMDAGIATLEVEKSDRGFNGREALHIIGKGESIGAFNWFYKVKDRYETYIDKEGIFPYRFIRNCDEGGHIIKQDYQFLPERDVVLTEKEDTFATPSFTQDMISAYYYARTLDFSHAKKGDKFTVTTIVDGEIFPVQIKYLGTETIKIRRGKFRCMKFAPVVQEGRIFKSEDDLTVWITDDENKIPILIKAKIFVGSIKMEVTDWTGLANDISKVN